MKHIIITIVLVGTVGCASILSKNQYPVSINSNPTGAKITIANKQGQLIATGTTPYMVTLSAKSGAYSAGSYTLTLEKDGHPITRSQLNATLDGWYIGNILFGGLLGILVIDPITGSMWKLPQSHIVNLSNNFTKANQPSLQVIELAQLTQDQKYNLIPILNK
jgi:hypothetical protein